jgi:thioredoxin reductase (NADPH)
VDKINWKDSIWMGTNNNTQHMKVIVVGSGPAGLSAALYAARAELAPVVLAGSQLGGQVALTHIIENYPGFPEGIGGSQLVELFQKQAEHFGARIVYDIANRIDLSQHPYWVGTDNGNYLGDTLIIAMGASTNRLNVPGEKDLTGRGVSYCATCDGWFFKDRKVVVVGGGDSALEEALFITRYASSVKIIHRREILRASPLLQKGAAAHPKIDFAMNKVVIQIIGSDKVEAVKLKDVNTQEEQTIETDGVFIFIGHTPNSSLFKGQLEMDSMGYLKIDDRMRTSKAGVFAAGEVADPHFRQVVTSAGMGAAAAMHATSFLQSGGKLGLSNLADRTFVTD